MNNYVYDTEITEIIEYDDYDDIDIKYAIVEYKYGASSTGIYNNQPISRHETLEDAESSLEEYFLQDVENHILLHEGNRQEALDSRDAPRKNY